MLSEAYAKCSESIEDGERQARSWGRPMERKGFVGPEGRIVLLKADKVQAGKTIPSTETASANRTRKSMVCPRMVRPGDVTGMETHADMEPEQVTPNRQRQLDF